MLIELPCCYLKTLRTAIRRESVCSTSEVQLLRTLRLGAHGITRKRRIAARISMKKKLKVMGARRTCTAYSAARHVLSESATAGETVLGSKARSVLSSAGVLDGFQV